jgi:hypothetical protein
VTHQPSRFPYTLQISATGVERFASWQSDFPYTTTLEEVHMRTVKDHYPG